MLVVERNGGGEYSAVEACHENMDESCSGIHMIESCHTLLHESCHTLLHQVLSAMAEVNTAHLSHVTQMDESCCGRYMIESCHTLLHQVLSAMADVSKAPVSIKCRLGAHARICTGAC